MDKEAELVFGTSLDSQHTMNVQDPRDDLTLAQATAVMQTVVAKNIFYLSIRQIQQGRLCRQKRSIYNRRDKTVRNVHITNLFLVLLNG